MSSDREDDRVSLGDNHDHDHASSEEMSSDEGEDEDEDDEEDYEFSDGQSDAHVDPTASSSSEPNEGERSVSIDASEANDSSEEPAPSSQDDREDNHSAIDHVMDGESDTSDESYRPPVRRSNRLAPVLAAVAGKGNSEPQSKSDTASRETEVTADRVRCLRAERDLARNQCCTLKDKVVAHELQEKELQDMVQRLQEEHAKAVSAYEERLQILAGKATASQCHDKHKLLNKPAQFDGKDSSKTKVVDWLLAMKQWLTAVGADALDHVTTAESYLRDEAMRYWLKRKALLSEQHQQSWTAFKDALLERFDAENTAESARIQLDRLRQGGSSMAKFVSQFDQISSYIDDMSDKDLIHRFLEAVSPDHRAVLRNNPSEGGPWTVYAHLRKYALNMFPEEGGSRLKPSSKPTFDTKKRPFRAAADSAHAVWEMARDRKKAKSAAGASQQQAAGGSGSDRWIEFRNAAGQTVQRTAAQRNTVFRFRLCGFCYRAGHSSGECRAKQPAKGDPPSTSSAK